MLTSVHIPLLLTVPATDREVRRRSLGERNDDGNAILIVGLDDGDLASGNGRNGAFVLSAVKVDDDALDRLSGRLGRDWFIANVAGGNVLDDLTGRARDETVTDL